MKLASQWPRPTVESEVPNCTAKALQYMLCGYQKACAAKADRDRATSDARSTFFFRNKRNDGL
jgi:hypothetical protein